MVCTFGDVTDVIWWRELSLDTRPILGKDGRILAESPAWLTSEKAMATYAELAGKTVFSAKAAMVDMLGESGDLVDTPENITHPVKFFEKGDKPLEIVTTRQWYISNGAKDGDLKNRLLERGKQVAFHPDFMRVRYENWVNGLSGDWLISRQRFFGVPIPVWYPLDTEGNPVEGEVLVPEESALPVDPSTDTPQGFSEDQRGVPGGFVGELDIMDTWATSSLTPQLAGRWEEDTELFGVVFPYDLRSQGQDIIRTWLFSSVLRAELEHGTIPWKNAGISGFIVDPDRKKMSKSKGNVVTPQAMLDDHGSDAVRYWAASSKLGTTVVGTRSARLARRATRAASTHSRPSVRAATASSTSALGIMMKASEPPSSRTVGFISCPQMDATDAPAGSEPVNVAARTRSSRRTRSTLLPPISNV